MHWCLASSQLAAGRVGPRPTHCAPSPLQELAAIPAPLLIVWLNHLNDRTLLSMGCCGFLSGSQRDAGVFFFWTGASGCKLGWHYHRRHPKRRNHRGFALGQNASYFHPPLILFWPICIFFVDGFCICLFFFFGTGGFPPRIDVESCFGALYFIYSFQSPVGWVYHSILEGFGPVCTPLPPPRRVQRLASQSTPSASSCSRCRPSTPQCARPQSSACSL